MTRARLVCSGENRIHGAEPAASTDLLRRKPFSCADDAVTPGRVFQRSDNGGADGDDSSALLSSPLYRSRSRCRDAIRFIEWQQAVQLRITG